MTTKFITTIEEYIKEYGRESLWVRHGYKFRGHIVFTLPGANRPGTVPYSPVPVNLLAQAPIDLLASSIDLRRLASEGHIVFVSPEEAQREFEDPDNREIYYSELQKIMAGDTKPKPEEVVPNLPEDSDSQDQTEEGGDNGVKGALEILIARYNSNDLDAPALYKEIKLLEQNGEGLSKEDIEYVRAHAGDRKNIAKLLDKIEKKKFEVSK